MRIPSVASRDFWRLYGRLPRDVRRLAAKSIWSDSRTRFIRPCTSRRSATISGQCELEAITAELPPGRRTRRDSTPTVRKTPLQGGRNALWKPPSEIRVAEARSSRAAHQLGHGGRSAIDRAILEALPLGATPKRNYLTGHCAGQMCAMHPARTGCSTMAAAAR